MIQNQPPSPENKPYFIWARQLNSYLQALALQMNPAAPKIIQLETIRAGAKPASDGLLMWDAVTGQPVISKGGEWRTIALGPAIPQP